MIQRARSYARQLLRRIYSATPAPIARWVATTLPPTLSQAIRRVLISTPRAGSTLADPILSAIVSELDRVRDLDFALDTLAADRARYLPVVRPSVISNVDGLLIKLLSRLPQATTHLVLTGRLALGGAERYAIALYDALAVEHGADRVALVVTDQRMHDAKHWLSKGTNLVMLDELQPMLDLDSKTYLLRHMIAAIRPRSIINVNSAAVWATLSQYGKPLSKLTSTYSALFCYDYRADGIAGGYARTHFADTFEAHAGYLIDNETFRRQLLVDFSVPSERAARLHTLYTPTPPSAHTRKLAADEPGRKQVLWASRFAHQKLPLLALEVARLRPDMDFHFFGSGASSQLASSMKAAAGANVSWRGQFSSPEALALGEFDAMLYTAVTDGIPTILLHVGSEGLPIVASAVGGIPELITDDTGWPVRTPSNPSEYALQLDSCLAAVSVAETRATRLKKLIAERHSEDAFRDTLAALLSRGTL